jgi:hypothetical protein
MDKEQKARWQHVGQAERTAVMTFLMDFIGLSATQTADWLVATTEAQDINSQQLLVQLAKQWGLSDQQWQAAYNELKAKEAIPVALLRTVKVLETLK